VLFFELFAPFMTLLSVFAAVWLYVRERRARHDPTEPESVIRPKPPRPAGGRVPEGTGRRPSMLP
jgi:hypothetical protein